jgi:hypothetical protein
MIYSSKIVMMTAFSLLSVLSAQAANTQLATTQAAKSTSIPISYLPFTITAPGTYVLTGNWNFASQNSIGPAIIISAAVTGPVVLDLKGFTMIGIVNAVAVLIGQTSSAVPNTYPITIRNGTFQNFGLGITTYGLLCGPI